MRRIGLLLLVVVPLVAGLAGCSREQGAPAAGRLRVEAAFYPLAFLAERVGGDAVVVDDLTPVGGEPHDLELKASQVAAIERADLTVYLKGFQPAIDQAVRSAKALDLSQAVPFQSPDAALAAEEEDVTLDPHVWLDPVRMAAMAEAVTARLAALAPARKAEIAQRGAALASDLRALDDAYRQRLATCARRDLVTSHAAFGYLARRYDLRQLGITGLNPDAEPPARRLIEVARFVRERNVTTIFFETLVSPKLAETLARETGTRTAVLDPIEGLEAGSRDDYLSIMRANLTALAAALGCR